MPDPATPADRYWRRNLRLIALLLAAWFGVSFVTMYFAQALTVDFFGWPLSFWIAAHGALLSYVGIIAWYAVVMNRRDREAGPPPPAAEPPPAPPPAG